MVLNADRVLFMDPEILKVLSDDQRTLVIEKLNSYNPKLNIGRISPFPGGASFNIAKRADSTRFALVAEDRGENSDHGPLASDEGVVETEGESPALYRAVLYLFVGLETSGRNVFVTQTFFPGLCALIDEMKAAPGIAFSSHPVYFLDLASGAIPDSVLRTLRLFTAMGVGYVSVYRADFDPAAAPRELEALLEAAGDQRAGRPYYSVDAEKRMLTYTKSQFTPGQLLAEGATSTNWLFNGSKDKFYWSEVLPVAVVAAHSGFGIDCSEVVSYLAGIRADSGEAKTSIKFDRTVALFKYIEKISELNR